MVYGQRAKLVLRFYENRRPSAATPGVVGADKSSRAGRNASLVAQCDAEPRANAKFVANRLRDAVRNNSGNTTETSHADRLDESNLCAAIPKAAATR